MTAALRVLVPLSFVVALSSVSCDETGPVRPAATTSASAPVPVPARWVADVRIASPAATFDELRAAIAGPLLLMPRTFGGLVVHLLALPVTVAELFDERLPVVAALSEGNDKELLAAAACHIRDGERVRSLLTSGNPPQYSIRPDGEVYWIERTSTLTSPVIPAKVALFDHYLVLGSTDQAVRDLAPYLARTLGPRPADAEHVVVELGERAFGPIARQGVTVQAAAARVLGLPAWLEPFVDLDGVVASATEMLARFGGGRLTVRLGTDAVSISATLKPKDESAAKWFEPLPTIEVARLLELPDDSMAAIAWVETSEGRRTRAAASAARLAGALGKDYKREDGVKLAEHFGALARGRGDRSTLALRCTGVGITGLASGDVADPALTANALDALAGLRKHALVRERMKAERIDVHADKRRLLRVPFEVTRLRLIPEADAAEPRDPIDFVWGLGDQVWFAAAGMETVGSMQHMVAPSLERSLDAKVAMKAVLAGVPKHAWLAALADPQGFHACMAGKPGGDFATPVMLGIGLDERRVRVELSVARTLLRLVGKLPF